jgi:hypothetical protein
MQVWEKSQSAIDRKSHAAAFTPPSKLNGTPSFFDEEEFH